MANNSQKSYTKATARGADVKDPAIGVRINGKVYVVDGQHRVNTALENRTSHPIAVMDGAFLDKHPAVKDKIISARKNNGR